MSVGAANGVAAGGAVAQTQRSELRRAAQAFESLFVQSLLTRMREAQLEEGFFGTGAGASVYEGMFESMLADHLSSATPLGIARMLEEQWTREDPDARAGSKAARAIDEIRAGRAYEAVLASSGPAAPGPTPRSGSESGSPASRSTEGVSRPFGWGRDPIDGTRRLHGGVDLPAPTGTPVRAVAGGRVVAVERGAGYGLEVRLDHGQGWTSRYAHLSSAGVRTGQWVVRGQRLGGVGSTGRSTGPHLHFEALRHGQRVDPALAAPGPLRPQVLGRTADLTQ